MNKGSSTIYIFALCMCIFLGGCINKEHIAEIQQQATVHENSSENIIEGSVTEENTEMNDNIEIHVPTKDEILAMRKLVLEGMSDNEIERQNENIKFANLIL